MLGSSPLASAPISATSQVQATGLNLVASDIAANSPIVDQIPLTQTHVVSVNSIEAQAIVIDNAIAEIKYNFVLTEISTTPSVDSINIISQHVIICDEITLGSPLVDSSIASLLSAITVDGITSGSINIDSIGLQEIYNFSASNLSTTPVVDTINIVSVHSILVNNLSSTPVLDSLSIDILGAISVQKITTTPIVGSISVIQDHSIVSNDLSSQIVPDSPELLVEHSFVANNLILAPTVEGANLTLQQIVSPQKITGGTAYIDSIVVQHLTHIEPNKLIATSRINPVPFNQVHILASDEILIGAPIAPSISFLWDFQQINATIWTEVSTVDDTWTVVKSAA